MTTMAVPEKKLKLTSSTSEIGASMTPTELDELRRLFDKFRATAPPEEVDALLNSPATVNNVPKSDIREQEDWTQNHLVRTRRVKIPQKFAILAKSSCCTFFTCYYI